MALTLHDAVQNWDEVSSPGTTYTPTTGATLLIVRIGWEEIGDAPTTINGVSSDQDGALTKAAGVRIGGGANDNGADIWYLENPSLAAHNFSITWSVATDPGDIHMSAFTLTGDVNATPVGSTGTDEVIATDEFSIGSLSHTAEDFGVCAGVAGFDSLDNLWTPDGNWTERCDLGDNSSSHFLQTRDYAGSGTDTVTATYSGAEGREGIVAAIFQGAAAGAKNFYGGGNAMNRAQRGMGWAA